MILLFAPCCLSLSDRVRLAISSWMIEGQGYLPPACTPGPDSNTLKPVRTLFPWNIAKQVLSLANPALGEWLEI